MRLLIATIAATLVVAMPNLSAQDHAKPKALPKSVEAKWVSTVKNHKTQDGATVAEVLAYVAKMRPREFKAGEIGVGYNGATGEPDSVFIGYWIGAKRLPGDSFVDLGYDMTPEGQVKPVASDEVMTTALEGGRDSFLIAVDDTYKSNCRADPDEQPSC